MFLTDFKQNPPDVSHREELVFQIVVPKGLELGAAGKAHQHMWEPSRER